MNDYDDINVDLDLSYSSADETESANMVWLPQKRFQNFQNNDNKSSKNTKKKKRS